MELVPSNFVLVACLLSLLVMVRVRRTRLGARRIPDAEQLDTVLAWPPTLTSPLSDHERQAYGLVRSALPNDLILAHIPLARFIRVPTRRSEGVWRKKAGRLRVDLLLCGEDGRPTAAVAVRVPDEPSRAAARRERIQRVLHAAGVPLHVWTAGRLPDVDAVRAQLSAQAAAVNGAALRTRPVAYVSDPGRSPEGLAAILDDSLLPEVTELGDLTD